MSKEFNYNIMLLTIADRLEDGSKSLKAVLMGTTDPSLWIVGTLKASRSLEDFNEEDQLYTSTNLNGVFGAIEYVKNYENDNFDSINTDLTDPEKVADMVGYINMECVLNDISNEFDIDIEEELTDQQANSIMKYIDKQLKN